MPLSRRHSSGDSEGDNSDGDWEIVNWHDALPDWNTVLRVFDVIAWYYTYFLEVMKRPTVRFACTGTAVVAASFFAYRYIQSRGHSTPSSSIPQIEHHTPSDPLVERQQWMRELEEEGRRAEEEREARRRLKLADARARRESDLSRMVELDSDDDVRRLQKARESEEALEKLKSAARLSRLINDGVAELEVRRLEQEGRAAMAQSELELRRARERYRQELDEIDERIRAEDVRFRRRNAEQGEELEEENRRSEARIQEIREQFERNLEAIRARARTRRREMEVLAEKIQKAFQMRVWNDIVEANWTHRLKMLRECNSDVQHAYSLMKRMRSAESHVAVENVLEAIESTKRLMDQEAVEMDSLYRNTGKSFLNVIREAVEQVSLECDRMTQALKNGNAVESERCYMDLSRALSEIPTMAELKRGYAESMRQGGF